MNVVVDEVPTVVDWLVGERTRLHEFHAKTGVADAPKAASVASSPMIIADFLFSRLM